MSLRKGSTTIVMNLLVWSMSLASLRIGPMLVTCEYCCGAHVEGETKCGNCGAPAVGDGSTLADFRHCPVCRRKLLALASPACSYCGRRLPDEYIKARGSDLKRISDVNEGEGTSELAGKVNELIRENARHKGGGSVLSLVDFSSLTDLFD